MLLTVISAGWSLIKKTNSGLKIKPVGVIHKWGEEYEEVDDIKGHQLKYIWIRGGYFHIDCQLPLELGEMYWAPFLACRSWPCNIALSILLLKQSVLLPKSIVQKFCHSIWRHMSLGLIISSQKHYRLPCSVFHLKASSLSQLLLCFLRHPKTHHNIVSLSLVRKGKKTRRVFPTPLRAERGQDIVKCFDVASFPHFNWAI